MSIKYRDSSGSLRCFLWNDIDRTNNAKYIRTRDKERKNIIKDIQEFPYTKYSGNPGFVYENYIKIN